MEPKRVLLLAPYKTGTIFVHSLIDHVLGVPCVRLHGYDEDERKKYPVDSFSHFITLRRENLRLLWLSALVQDIDVTAYEYAFGTTEYLASAGVDDVVRHFQSQDWTKYRWLNYAYYDEQLSAFAGRGVPTLTLTTEHLGSTASKLAEFLKCDVPSPLPCASHVTGEGPKGRLYASLRHALDL